jgi:hypothetical protein
LFQSIRIEVEIGLNEELQTSEIESIADTIAKMVLSTRGDTPHGVAPIPTIREEGQSK